MSSIFQHSRGAAALHPVSVPFDARRGLTLLVFMQLMVWTIFPIIGHHTPPLDVIEMHTWAGVPQLGYYKHPPLPAWGIYLSELLFGRSSFAVFFPSALSISVTTLAVWPLARRFFGPCRALAALFLQSTVGYYNLYAPDYNHNVAQMPFWALAVCAFYFAITDGRKRWWCAFGAALGITALGKYSAVFLPLGCLLLLAWDKRSRRHLTFANVLLAAASFAMLFGPHFAWLVGHDFEPVHYLSRRMGDLAADATWTERFVSYCANQLAVHAFVLGISVYLTLSQERKLAFQAATSDAQRLDDRFLVALGLGPFVATLLVGLTGSYLHALWASAMFPLSGLLAVRVLGARSERLVSRTWCLAWIALMLALGGLYAAKNTVAWYRLTGKYARASYPGPELARVLDGLWRAEAPGRPLRNVVGTPWEAGVASFFSAERTLVAIDADFAISPWITHDEVARCGAIVAWDPGTDMLPALRRQFPNVNLLPLADIDPDRPGTTYRRSVATAIIPPSPGVPPSACPAR